MHAGNSMTAEEIDELLFADRLDLAGFDGFGGHFMRNIGKNRAQAHYISGSGNLQDHCLAVTRSGGNLDLAETYDEDVPSRVALGEELCASRVAHHDSNIVEVLQRFGREIAEHPQMTVLTIQTI